MKIKATFFVMSMTEFVDGVEYHNNPTAHSNEQEAEAAMNKKADEWIATFKEIEDFKPKETRTCDTIEVKDENAPDTNIKIWIDKVSLEVEI